MRLFAKSLPLMNKILAASLLFGVTGMPLPATAKINKPATSSIIDFDLPALIEKGGRDNWALDRIEKPAALSAADFHANIIPRQEAPFYLEVDEYRGVPVINYPLVTAPGTNGLKPDLKLQIGGDLNEQIKGFGASFAGMEKIKECEGAGLCLGEKHLIPVKGAKGGSLFTVQNNPRVLIRKIEGGYLLEDGSGLRQYYTPASMETIETGPWEINAVSDWFENFILYDYSPETGLVTSIFYGQDGAEKKNLRKIHFQYDAATGRIPEGIVTMVGSRVVRNYSLTRNSQGRLTGITECVSGKDAGLSCYAPYSFNWLDKKALDYGVLASVQNGIGGVTKIEYRETKYGPTVASLDLLSNGQNMQAIQYHFKKPQVKNGKLLGYTEARSSKKGSSVAHVTEYGTGKYAGVVIRDGARGITGKQTLESVDLSPLSEVEYLFKDTGNDATSPYLLKETVTRSYGPDGKVAAVQRESREYDAKGRIKMIANKGGEDHFTYLDETDAEHIGEVAGNLIAERRHKQAVSGEVSSKKWHYKFDAGILVKSTISGSVGAQKQSRLATEQWVDDHGNIAKIKTGGRVTSFSYDEETRTFPRGMQVDEKGQKSVASWIYDTATGRPISEKLTDGSGTVTKLDEMGRVTSVLTTLVDPRNPGKSGKRAEITLEESSSYGSTKNGLTVTKTITEMKNKITGERFSKTANIYTDSLGRIVRIQNESAVPGGKVLSKSSLENIYSANGQETIVHDEAGGVQKTRFNTNGQIIREETDIHGVTEFIYDDAGRITALIKNGDKIDHEYDSRGRLVLKRLPGDIEYRYAYDKTYPSKVSRAELPSGKIIEYSYSVQGQVGEKRVQIPDGKGKKIEFSTSFTYQNSQLKSVEYPDGSEVIYQYEGSRLASINWGKKMPENGASRETPIVRYVTQKTGKRARSLFKDLGNGIREQYSWGEDGRLKDLSFGRKAADGKTVHSFTELAYQFGSETGLIEQEERTDFLRDTENNLVQSYKYDEARRLLNFSAELNGRSAERASYKQFNERQKIEGTDPAAVNIQGKTFAISYDKYGNISRKKSDKVLSEFLFDVENKLQQSAISTPRKTIKTDYEYDQYGERLEKRIEGGATTLYVSPFYEFTQLPDGKMQETLYVWDHMGRIAAFTNEVKESDFAGLVPAMDPSDTEGEEVTDADRLLQSVKAAFMTPFDGWNERVPDFAQSLMPLVILSLIVFLLAALFERLSGSQIVQRAACKYSSRRPVFNFVAILAIGAMLTLTLAPTAQAALEAGDGTPKINQVTFFHHDVRGSVIAVSDEAGNQTASAAYHPYGAVADTEMTAGNNNFRVKFAGMELDGETGLYYDHARYYDPEMGKFLSRDPARQLRDAYAYTDRDPVNYIDPDGRMMQELVAVQIPYGGTVEGQPDVEVTSAVPAPASSGSEQEVLDGDQAKVSRSEGEKSSLGGAVSSVGRTGAEQPEIFLDVEVASSVPAVTAGDIELAVQDPEQFRATGSTGERSSAEDAASSLEEPDWVRYPTFWNWTFGVTEGAAVPEVPAAEDDPATAEEEAEFNKFARSGYMQGWTRMGGYLQSLLGAGLLAWWFPTSYTYNAGGTVTPGVWSDLGLYAMTVTAFSAYGKGYTANESMYWKEAEARGATSQDYLDMTLRRMFWKVSVQVVAFTALTFFARWARGFPIFDEDNSGTDENIAEIAFLILKNFVFSTLGTAALVPYYLTTKAPSATYDSEITDEELNEMPWWRRWAIKTSIAYRVFVTASGFWDTDVEPYTKEAVLQAMWYPIYVLQMYVWYFVGSAGYYGGFASVVPLVPQIGWDAFFKAWERNLTLIIMSPAASPFAYLNYWHRKSYTIIKKRSAANPRTSGFMFRILGPVEGLRLAKFSDSAYLPQDEWLQLLEAHRAMEVESVLPGAPSSHEPDHVPSHLYPEVSPDGPD